jgi:Protein of unknown function (DUF992)
VRVQASSGKTTKGAIVVKHYLVLATLVFPALVAPAVAQGPQPWTQVGVLTCTLNPSIGFIIAGHQSMECSYAPSGPYPPQAYQGAINSVGLDVGVTAGGVLAWTVLAPTQGVAAGALAGEYVGASGDIGIGIGVGANVLVGGSGRTFALQPLSVEGSISLNIALGVSMLKLHAI